MEIENHFEKPKPERGYRVLYATAGYLAKRGFGAEEGFPYIFDGQMRYHRIANQFLLDLGKGVWSLKTRGTSPSMRPTAATMRHYAHSVGNYLEFCEAAGVDPLKTEYLALLQQYQQAMLDGRWSARNERLSGKTVNVRVDAAIMFLTWAADKGMRKSFVVPTFRRSIALGRQHSSGVKSTKEVEARKGKVRVAARRLRMPQESEVVQWLLRMQGRSQTEALIAELILESAIRREEAACWRLDTLPLDPQDWEIDSSKPQADQQVRVTIRYGTKGPDFGSDHGDKIGPERQIHIPLQMAQKLHDYREYVRPQAIRTLLKQARNGREAKALREGAVRLFLHPQTGERYTGQQIYDGWTAPSVDCPKGWHPHTGRHFWACTLLWRHLQSDAALAEALVNASSRSAVSVGIKSALMGTVGDFINLTIKPQLGHVSSETTMIYVQWVADRLKLNLNLMEKYDNALPPDNVGDLEEDEGGEGRP